jgi:hypothetical protein
MTEKIKKPIAYITPSLSIRDQYDAVIQRPEIGDMLALLTYAQTMSYDKAIIIETEALVDKCACWCSRHGEPMWLTELTCFDVTTRVLYTPTYCKSPNCDEHRNLSRIIRYRSKK